MNKLLLIVAVAVLSGCASVASWIPSFSDPNQSAAIVHVRFAVDRIDCAVPQAPQVARVRDHLDWFALYSQSSGARHQDVVRVITPMRATVTEWHQRVLVRDGSVAYCEIKKSVLQTQSARAAEVILGRF